MCKFNFLLILQSSFVDILEFVFQNVYFRILPLPDAIEGRYQVDIDSGFEEDNSNGSFLQLLNEIENEPELSDLNEIFDETYLHQTEMGTTLYLRDLEGCHVTEKFLLITAKGETRIEIADLKWGDMIDIKTSDNDAIVVKRLPRQMNKIEKFCNRKIENKRSIAYADNIVRGLALWEMSQSLELTRKDGDKRARKVLLNKFTNCSRKDRAAGKKLEKDLLKKHEGEFTKFSTYEEISKFFSELTIFVFDPKGYIKFVSPILTKNCAYFYEGNNDFFIIKNIRGFCRVDN